MMCWFRKFTMRRGKVLARLSFLKKVKENYIFEINK
jgi:hypothetical protein